MNRTLAIDARKIADSGIGRYLRNLLPLVLPRLSADTILLIGHAGLLAEQLALDARCTLLATGAAPHSLAEQRLAFHPALRRAHLLWVPHYNLPVLRGGAIVSTIHDLAPIELADSMSSTAARLAAHALLQVCAWRSSAILTPSHFSRDRIVQRLCVPPARVHVTPLAADPAWPRINAGDLPARSDDNPYLLFVGNLKPNKNLSGVLAALRLLGSRCSLPLWVAGRVEGFRTGDREAYLQAASLGERVRLLGAVTDEELIRLYRGATALVMPSLYEGFGLPVLEAMRNGCVVVTSRGTSLQEVAGDAAILVDPRNPSSIAEGILAAMDAGVQQRLRLAGLARESGFHYAHAAEVTAMVLNTNLAAAIPRSR